MTELNKILANLIDMSLITKQAHWNMKGVGFIAVHELLDTCTDNLRDAYDTVAEFLASRNIIALGTIDFIRASSSLPPYPTNIIDVQDHVSALSDHYELLINFIEDVKSDLTIDTEQSIADDVLQMLRKDQWKIRSNLAYTI